MTEVGAAEGPINPESLGVMESGKSPESDLRRVCLAVRCQILLNAPMFITEQSVVKKLHNRLHHGVLIDFGRNLHPFSTEMELGGGIIQHSPTKPRLKQDDGLSGSLEPCHEFLEMSRHKLGQFAN